MTDIHNGEFWVDSVVSQPCGIIQLVRCLVGDLGGTDEAYNPRRIFLVEIMVTGIL